MALPRPTVGRLPLGLLDFFQMKTMGEYPQHLSDSISPVMDLMRWFDPDADSGYTSPTAIVANASAANALNLTSAQWTSGTGAFDFALGGSDTRVPDNQLWIVLECTVSWSMNDPAGTADFFVSAQQSTSNNTRFLVTDGPLQGFTTGAAAPPIRQGQRSATKPFVMGPGMLLVGGHGGLTVGAGNVAWNVFVRIRRLQR